MSELLLAIGWNPVPGFWFLLLVRATLGVFLGAAVLLLAIFLFNRIVRGGT